MNLVNHLAKKYNCQASSFKYSNLVEKYVLGEEVDAGLKENVKEFFKKIILPAALLVGPLACGQSGVEQDAAQSEKKAEQLLNKEFSKHNIACDIKKTGGGQVWIFKDKIANDTFKLMFNAETESDGLVIIDYSEPMIDMSANTLKMKTFQDSLVDYFSEQGGTMGTKMRDAQKQYSCK